MSIARGYNGENYVAASDEICICPEESSTGLSGAVESVFAGGC